MFPEIILGLTIFLSIFACACSILSLTRADNPRLRKLARWMGEMEADFTVLNDSQQRLYKSVHKLRTRAGTEDARKKKVLEAFDENEADPQKDPDKWKDQMQRKYPMGALSVVRGEQNPTEE